MNQQNFEAPLGEFGIRQLIDAVASEKFQSMQENWYRWTKIQGESIAIHGSGAVLQRPSPSTVGGILVTANTHYFYPAIYIENDYAGGDIEMLTVFETNESNLGGRTQDRVRLAADFYYKDMRPRLNRAVDPYEITAGIRRDQNAEVMIGKARRYQTFVIRHTFAAGSTITPRTNSILKAKINLCTAHSTISTVIVNYVLMGYPTKSVHAPLNIPVSSE